MIILGVDPGVSGALAFFSTDQTDQVGVYDMPILDGDVDPHLLHRLIGDRQPAMAMIERSHPHPKEGVSSVWRYASAFTTAVVVIKLLKIPLVFVTPAQWKKSLHLTKDKEQSRARAIETFPYCAAAFQLKKHHNRAEAAMLAYYASTLPTIRNHHNDTGL
jgi:crossover junction endodeoxyribonuclease RuvC